MELDLRGRASRMIDGEVLRELTFGDLEAVQGERGTKPVRISRISQRHHALARLVALGTRDKDAGVMLGFTPSRISILKGDPSFQELVAFYKESVDGAFADMAEQLAGLSMDMVLELRDRFEDDPTKFSTAMILEVLKTTADRSGFGPMTKATNFNVNVNLGDKLQAARERAKKALGGGDSDG